jgi:hypothetical protein
MKTYTIVNGEDTYTLKKKLSLSDAITWAQNHCDHSLPIEVKEKKSEKKLG